MTANQVTLVACLISIAIGTLLASVPHEHTLFLLVPAWLFVRMALNTIDGILAREFGQKTALGAYLNELTDVVSDARRCICRSPSFRTPIRGSFAASSTMLFPEASTLT